MSTQQEIERIRSELTEAKRRVEFLEIELKQAIDQCWSGRLPNPDQMHGAGDQFPGEDFPAYGHDEDI